MYRTVFTILLFCYSGPLWACSCGGTLTYAPIVAAPVTAFGRTVETIETNESVVPKAVEVRTVDKPAIPKSIYPANSFAREVAGEPVKMVARKPRPTLGRLQIYDLPLAIRTEQVKESPAHESEVQTIDVGKPPIPSFENEQSQKDEEGTENLENTVVLPQSPSFRGSEGIKLKPELPEGPSSAPLPSELMEPSEKNESKENPPPTSGPPKNQDHEDQGQENSALPGSVPGRTGSMDSQSWTITALVLLSAISTVAFLCTVFVVGEYRKRWLNAIMSQNGMVPNFQGGLYDVPSLSIGYRRYED